MSNSLAIAAVTSTLQSLLMSDDDIQEVTTRPPDKLADAGGADRLNLFLYSLMPNAAWRNMNMPGQVKRSENGFSPLALELYYLLTAYGNDTDTIREQQLLGRAMGILHDNAILDRQAIRDATQANGLERADLHQQVERVRITPHPLSWDEQSKMWSAFQVGARLSTAYHISVVLIESERRSPAALPVLRRGERDQGVHSLVGLDPLLNQIVYRDMEGDEPALPGATRGSTVTLLGKHIPVQDSRIVVRDPKRDGVNVVPPIQPSSGSRSDQLKFQLSPELGEWQAGWYSVAIEFQRDGMTRSSNSLPLAVTPQVRVRSDGRPVTLAFSENDQRKLKVSVATPLGANRSTFLILNREGDSFQLPRDNESLEDSPATPVFLIDPVPAGQYRLRVRHDGIDSLSLTPRQENGRTRFFEFDPAMIVEL